MPQSITIQPIDTFEVSLRPPGSKSLTNRALLLAALVRGRSRLTGVLLSDDTRVMLAALDRLGFELQLDEIGREVVLLGSNGGIPAGEAHLHLGNAGTAYRFLTAAVCVGKGTYTLDGVARMRERPIAQLVEPLRDLGAGIQYESESGFPPLRIKACGLRGRELTLEPTLSSQYISALLQVGPYVEGGLTVRFNGPVTSRPYVVMTLRLMERFGVAAEVDRAFTRIHVPQGGYTACDYAVEPDASNASYFLAAAAIVPGSKCTIEGLGRASLQGDVGFADVLHQMGASLLFGGDFITVMAPPEGETLRGIDIDLNAMPDMAQTLAAVALFAHGPTTMRNIGNLRVKETDRLAALATELGKLGATVEVEADDMTITPPPDNRIHPAAIDTYDDHRMAMSFSIIGLRAGGVTINDPACVNKTFPEYFEYLERLGGAGAAGGS